ncbi:MAG: class A beta-lactamase-related serine hydrolase, partial [Verrucomicrobia bacterium]
MTKPVMFAKRRAVLGFLLALVVAVSADGRSAFRAEKLAEMDSAINAAISDAKCPGGVLWLEHGGEIYRKAFGQRAVEPEAEAMTEDTIFDAASLTKVVATTPSVMLLIERGKVQLDAPVTNYIPEFAANGKEAVTIRHLLTHTSGLRPGIPAKPDWSGYDEGIRLACAEKLVTAPGTAFKYSDINFITLGEIVRRVSGVPLNEFVAREIYAPLGMTNSGFLPPAEKLPRIAPTEKLNSGEVLRGKVHDPTARRMGGLAGHAGLFLTASDLACYARMYLNAGELDGVRIFKP